MSTLSSPEEDDSDDNKFAEYDSLKIYRKQNNKKLVNRDLNPNDSPFLSFINNDMNKNMNSDEDLNDLLSRQDSVTNGNINHEYKIEKPEFSNSSQKCPICLENKSCIILKNCKHAVCEECFRNYIKNNFKEIDKYPLRCFDFKCHAFIYDNEVRYFLQNQKEQLKIFERLSVLCALPLEQRDTCPKCQNIHFVEKKIKLHPNIKWISDQDKDRCLNCTTPKKFTLAFRKHHCRICGDIFCNDCTHYRVSIMLASPEIVNACISYNNSTRWSKLMLDKDKPSPINNTNLDVQKLYSVNEKILEQEQIRCCLQCYLLVYRNVCPDCGYEYCGLCHQSYHRDVNCNENDIRKQQDLRQESKSLQFIRDNNFRACPGCGQVIAKSEGCNHITHKGCPKPNEGTDCHFCYDCGDMLYESNHQHEKNGTIHFPDGVFSHCRKWKESKKHQNIVFGNQKSTCIVQ